MGNCKNCKFYDPHIDSADYDGRCTRFPPGFLSGGSFFPLVNSYWVCGEFKDKNEEEQALCGHLVISSRD